MSALPLGSVVAVALMILVPLVTLGLHLIDRNRNDGYISILGRR